MQKHEKSCIVKDNRKHLIKYCPLLEGSLKAPRCDSLSLLSNSPLGLLGTRQDLTTLLLPFNLINPIQYFRIPNIHYFSTVNMSFLYHMWVQFCVIFSTFRYLAASQLQSIDARKVFPCFDEPDLKANFSVSIEHKEGKNLDPA